MTNHKIANELASMYRNIIAKIYNVNIPKKRYDEYFKTTIDSIYTQCNERNKPINKPIETIYYESMCNLLNSNTTYDSNDGNSEEEEHKKITVKQCKKYFSEYKGINFNEVNKYYKSHIGYNTYISNNTDNLLHELTEIIPPSEFVAQYYYIKYHRFYDTGIYTAFKKMVGFDRYPRDLVLCCSAIVNTNDMLVEKLLSKVQDAFTEKDSAKTVDLYNEIFENFNSNAASSGFSKLNNLKGTLCESKKISLMLFQALYPKYGRITILK